MFLKKITKTDHTTAKQYHYYRLCESYRIADKTRHHNLLNVGKLDGLDEPERKLLADRIEELLKGSGSLFTGSISRKVESKAQHFYSILKNKKLLSAVQPKSPALLFDEPADWEEVNLRSIKDEECREIGTEWLCKQAIEQLELEKFFCQKDWRPQWLTRARIALISRCVYPSSELKTEGWLHLNSALCELYNVPWNKITRKQLYQVSRMLYKEKENMERYLSEKTNELYDIEDKLFIYDLTNFYFEGKKASSRMAQYGRSKEKRSDAKLIALALVVNQAGFIKYSKLYEGNMKDTKTLLQTVDDLSKRTSVTERKPVIVMDAGIATDDNLRALREKGYEYVCVTSFQMNQYKANTSEEGAIVLKDKRDHPLYVKRIEKTGDPDGYLYIRSQQKEKKEDSMEELRCKRFEEGLKAIQGGIAKKSGTKERDKVHQRIGRMKEKFSSVNRHYTIKVKVKDNKAVNLTWTKKEKEHRSGIYFLRTTLKTKEEKVLWDIYNTIREVESTFRCLKTDLKLRPVFHQFDINSEAHLFLGVLAYQVVHTIRYGLKQKNIHHDWRNIVRIMSSQKSTTTSMQNKNKQVIHLRKCSEPQEQVREIYNALSYKYKPYSKKKFVLPETENHSSRSSMKLF